MFVETRKIWYQLKVTPDIFEEFIYFMAVGQSGYSRRAIALFWLSVVAIVIGVLISTEQLAVLYVLATLALVVLLVVVGRADLETVNRNSVGFNVKE